MERSFAKKKKILFIWNDIARYRYATIFYLHIENISTLSLQENTSVHDLIISITVNVKY